MGTESLLPRPNWWHLCPLFIYSQMSTNQGKFRQAGWPPRAHLERKIKVKWKKELSLSSWLWILFRERSAFTLKVRPQIPRKCPEWGEGRALWLWGPHDALEGAGWTLSLTCTLCSQLWERPLARDPNLLALPSASTPILTFGSHSLSPVKVFAIPQTPRTLSCLFTFYRFQGWLMVSLTRNFSGASKFNLNVGFSRIFSLIPDFDAFALF